MADEQDERYQEAKRRVDAKKGFYVHAFFFVVLNAIFLAAIGWVFLWATVFWGLGLALHGASVFFTGSDWVKRWEHRAIEKELGRQAGDSTSSSTSSGAQPPPPPPPPPPTSPPAADATEPGATPQRANAANPT